jgi:hypothetical protein
MHMDKTDLEAALLLVPVYALFFILLLPLAAYCIAKAGRGFRRCLSDILIGDYVDEACER